MTDRMTERFDTPGASGSPNADVTDQETSHVGASTGATETVRPSAALDEVTLGQGTGSSGDASVKDHAGAVAKDAKEGTKGVASTAASEAKDVAHEAKTQFRQLFTQLTGEATDQASGQTRRAVGGLRSLSSELSGMAENQQGPSGMAADLARQGASQLDAAANWLEGREPGEILEEVRSFARRRPGAFIAGATILGIVGGRMTRGLTGDSSDGSNGQSSPQRLLRRDPRWTHRSRRSAVRLRPASGGGDTAYAADALDLEGTDPTRVDAGIDPATYTHPGSSTGVVGESR